jgi:quinol monooxygenase YgiN
MPMLINAVVYTFPEEKADEAERLFRELRAASLAEQGCQGYEVCRGDGDAPGTFVLYEKWADAAALEAHYGHEHFQRLGVNGVRPLALSRSAVKGTPVE